MKNSYETDALFIKIWTINNCALIIIYNIFQNTFFLEFSGFFSIVKTADEQQSTD